jgi:CBS domain-containing protein
VAELMTIDVVTLYAHSLFRDAVDLLARNPFHHLLVTEIDGRLAGVISDRDVLRAADTYDAETTLVADIMTPEPMTLSADTPLSAAITMTLDYHINACRLSIMRGGCAVF